MIMYGEVKITEEEALLSCLNISSSKTPRGYVLKYVISIS
jgi:hypothetical protein